VTETRQLLRFSLFCSRAIFLDAHLADLVSVDRRCDRFCGGIVAELPGIDADAKPMEPGGSTASPLSRSRRRVRLSADSIFHFDFQTASAVLEPSLQAKRSNPFFSFPRQDGLLRR
jgi:hypothetical protein